MYYEQKGSDKGVARTQQCLDIISHYLATLE